MHSPAAAWGGAVLSVQSCRGRSCDSLHPSAIDVHAGARASCAPAVKQLPSSCSLCRMWHGPVSNTSYRAAPGAAQGRRPWHTLHGVSGNAIKPAKGVCLQGAMHAGGSSRRNRAWGARQRKNICNGRTYVQDALGWARHHQIEEAVHQQRAHDTLDEHDAGLTQRHAPRQDTIVVPCSRQQSGESAPTGPWQATQASGRPHRPKAPHTLGPRPQTTGHS